MSCEGYVASDAGHMGGRINYRIWKAWFPRPIHSHLRCAKCLHLCLIPLADVGTGLHEIIFSIEAACSLAAGKGALYRALTRWKCLWDIHKDRAPKGTRGHLGLYENASEYWWLAKLFLDKGTPSPAGQNRKAFDQDSMQEVHEFAKRFAEMHIA